MAYHIFVVDDELPNLESLERILKADGAIVTCFQNPQEVIPLLQKQKCDLLLSDLRMDGISGLELLEAVKHIDPSIGIILMTAYGTVEIAVEALKKGAFDFITKPFNRLQLLKVIHQALEKKKLISENLSLKEELQGDLQGLARNILGGSFALKNMMDIAYQAARSEANVLIEGESGTGKGLLAEYLHRQSPRKDYLFVKINCTAIPDNLLEAELFGYEPGAFTGAQKRKKGRVELADLGTLFLDEIGIAPLTFQSKLLRFLQEGEFERLGSNETLKVNTRVISATNTNLKKAIETGLLREDLFYRLNVIHIRVPALRERKEDIPLLVHKFLNDCSKKNHRALPEISEEALKALQGYDWPGNIRELQNCVERLVVLNRTGKIDIWDVPQEISKNSMIRSVMIPIGVPLREVEKIVMEQTLKNTQGDKRLAAQLLGIHPRTLYRFLEKEETIEVSLESEKKDDGVPKEV